MNKHTFIELAVFVVAVAICNFLFDLGYWSLLVGVLAAALFKTIWPKMP